MNDDQERGQGYRDGFAAGKRELDAVFCQEMAKLAAERRDMQMRAEAARKAAYNDGYAVGFTEGERAARLGGKFKSAPREAAERREARLDEHRARQLLQLCHPDKHGGSRAATEVSQWLNAVLKEMR
jgi:flagellar biosynthesis/type III secretory pathway protein FliH